MNFFKAVFADDSDSSDVEENQPSLSESSKRSPKDEEEEDDDNEDHDAKAPLNEHGPESYSNPSPKYSAGFGWNFGGLIKNLSTKSESVLQTYSRDLEEFRSGLRKETEVIREVATRAVKELPVKLDVGASVAQVSLESVGHAIDEFGTSVWRGTSEIISHGKDAFLAADHESDSSDSQQPSNPTLSSKRYSRFEAQVHAVQTDVNTYCKEPEEDLGDFNKWKSGFVLEEKAEEIENLSGENGVMEGIYAKLVPSAVSREVFWTRYFYRVYKLKQVEDARANLVKRVISREEEEDLSWDVDDDDETTDFADTKVNTSEERNWEKEGSSEIASGKKPVEEQPVSSPEVVAKTGEWSSHKEIENMGQVAESSSDSGSDTGLLVGKPDSSESGLNGDDSVTKYEEKALLEGKTDTAESSKDSDFSIVSSHPSFPEEEEDLGWDEIEDLGSSDDKKEAVSGSPNRADLRKRLSAADEEEDLSWDIEDDDEPVKS